MDDALQREIATVRKMKVKELQGRYRELFGEPTPSSNRAHLFRRIAWRLQALADGGLSERARERAAQLAVPADLRLRAPRSFWKEIEKRDDAQLTRDRRLPQPGTKLTRSHGGEMHVTEVLEEGFAYQGRTYRSLSAIAYAATGTRWNGYAFFGLNKDRNA